MNGKQLLAVAAVALFSFTGCAKESDLQELKQWLDNYTDVEQLAFQKINQNYDNIRLRLCQLEGIPPGQCPPDPGTVPTPPDYP